VFHFKIKNAKGGPEKKLGDSLRANPGNMISSLKQIQPKLMTGSFAFPWVRFTPN